MGTLIIFILVLSLLVFVHEFGHFITARKSGMKVYEFGFGFPPRAFGFYRDPKTKKLVFVSGKGKSKLSETVGGEDREHPDEFPSTLYSVNWLPLGGFVKIKGENGELANDPDSFGYQKYWKKALVLVAGVTMNFLLAAVLFSGGLIVGLPADASLLQDPDVIVVEDPRVIVQQVRKDSPAQAAGVQFGDIIASIGLANSQDVQDVANSVQVHEFISSNNSETLLLGVERNGEIVNVEVTPGEISGESAPKVGVVLGDAGIIRYPWYKALYKGFVQAWYATISIFISFYLLIKGLILGQGMAFDVSGPVGIAVVVGQTARLGFAYLLNATAMLSLSLAVINILPIPALDGGRLVFVTIERIFGRPVPLKYEQLAHTFGFLLLMALIVVVTWRDILGLL